MSTFFKGDEVCKITGGTGCKACNVSLNIDISYLKEYNTYFKKENITSVIKSMTYKKRVWEFMLGY